MNKAILWTAIILAVLSGYANAAGNIWTGVSWSSDVYWNGSSPRWNVPYANSSTAYVNASLVMDSFVGCGSGSCNAGYTQYCGDYRVTVRSCDNSTPLSMVYYTPGGGATANSTFSINFRSMDDGLTVHNHNVNTGENVVCTDDQNCRALGSVHMCVNETAYNASTPKIALDIAGDYLLVDYVANASVLETGIIKDFDGYVNTGYIYPDQGNKTHREVLPDNVELSLGCGASTTTTSTSTTTTTLPFGGNCSAQITVKIPDANGVEQRTNNARLKFKVASTGEIIDIPYDSAYTDGGVYTKEAMPCKIGDYLVGLDDGTNYVEEYNAVDNVNMALECHSGPYTTTIIMPGPTVRTINATVRAIGNETALDFRNYKVKVAGIANLDGLGLKVDLLEAECEQASLQDSEWRVLTGDSQTLNNAGVYRLENISVYSGLICGILDGVGGYGSVPYKQGLWQQVGLGSYFPGEVEINHTIFVQKQEICLDALDEKNGVRIENVSFTVKPKGESSFNVRSVGAADACWNATFSGNYREYDIVGYKSGYMTLNEVGVMLAPGENVLPMVPIDGAGDSSRAFKLSGYVVSNVSTGVQGIAVGASCDGKDPPMTYSASTGSYSLYPIYDGDSCTLEIREDEYKLLGCGTPIGGCSLTMSANRTNYNITVGRKNADDRSAQIPFHVFSSGFGGMNIPGAKIIAMYGGIKMGEATTDSAGLASILLSQGSTYEIYVSAENFRNYGQTMTVSTQRQEIDLIPSDAQFTLNGLLEYYNVTAGNTTQGESAPLRGAIISVYKDEKNLVATLTSDGLGQYQFGGEAGVQYRISINYKGVEAQFYYECPTGEGRSVNIPKYVLGLRQENTAKNNQKVNDFFQKWAYPLSYLLLVLLGLIVLGMFLKAFRKSWSFDD